LLFYRCIKFVIWGKITKYYTGNRHTAMNEMKVTELYFSQNTYMHKTNKALSLIT